MDKVDRETRSRIMSKVKSKNTKPEMVIRSLLHRMGYRFRLHANIPGKPDIVLPRHRKAILVHGCFWHGHTGCKRSKRPINNSEYWHKKIERNICRDVATISSLEELGWQVLVIWECEIEKLAEIKEKLKAFLA